MKIEYPKLADTPVSHLPFSPCVKVGDFLFISGQASVDKTGKIIPDTFENECRRSFENLKKILEDVGSDLEHVVSTRNFVRDPADVACFQKVYKEFFKPPYPARTTVSSCLGGNIKFETEAIAVLKTVPIEKPQS